MIPDSAVEAAAKAYINTSSTVGLAEIEAILVAAAPHMLAAAWSEGFTDAYYLERGYELDGRQNYELPENLKDDVKVWNRYKATQP